MRPLLSRSPTSVPDVTLLLAGPTGAGKSTTGNKLSGQQAFSVGSGLDSVTCDCAITDFQLPKEDSSGSYYLARIIDTAGFGDSELSASEQLKLFERFADQAPQGLDGVLFVVGRGRWGRDVQDSMRVFFEMLGGEEVKDNTMLLVTKCGQGDHAGIEEQLRSSDVFRKWGAHFKGGCCCIDNKVPDAQAAIRGYVWKLLRHARGRRWSNRHLTEAREWRQAREARVRGLPLDLQTPCWDKLQALQQGRTTRAVVDGVLSAQQQLHDRRQLQQQRRREEQLQARQGQHNVRQEQLRRSRIERRAELQLLIHNEAQAERGRQAEAAERASARVRRAEGSLGDICQLDRILAARIAIVLVLLTFVDGNPRLTPVAKIFLELCGLGIVWYLRELEETAFTVLHWLFWLVGKVKVACCRCKVVALDCVDYFCRAGPRPADVGPEESP